MNRSFRDRYGAILILSFFVAFLTFWFGPYGSASSVLAVDLPGHVALVMRTARQLDQFRVLFYDRWWFSGWPAFEYYGFLPYVVTALFAKFLGLLTRDPSRLAVMLTLLAGCAALPLSLYYASLPLAREVLGVASGKTEGALRLLALICCALSLWFLNQPLDWFGIGAGSLWHGGLFTQVFGWHLGLLFLGALYRFLLEPDPRRAGILAIACALLLLTHGLTGLFFLWLGILALLRFEGHRVLLASALGLGFALTALVTLPFLATSQSFTTTSIYPPQGDFLELFFKYPLRSLVETFRQWARGVFIPLDLTYLFLWVLTVGALASGSVRRTRIVSSFFVFSLLSIICFSSVFVSASIPLGIHYYRFHAYTFLLLTQLCCVVPVAFLRDLQSPEGSAPLARIARSVIVGGALLAILSSSMVSSLRGTGITRADERLSFRQQYEVLQFLGAKKAQAGTPGNAGRVMFEYFRDRELFRFLSPHFMSSRLGRAAGRESVNGLMIQSSLAYEFPATSLHALGAEVYRNAPLDDELHELNRETALQQLRDLGVSDLVLSSKGLVQELESHLSTAAKWIGPYAVLSIASTAPPLIAENRKELIGYDDRAGTLPFKYVEFYFYTHPQLYRRFEVIDLVTTESFPMPLAARLINQDDRATEVVEDGGTVPQITFTISPAAGINPMVNRYSVTPERDAYLRASRVFESAVLPVLTGMPVREESNLAAASVPTLSFEDLGQTMKLEGLQPGALYRINYSYFPYWVSGDGDVIRGSAERIFFRAVSESARLTYSRWSSRAVLGGGIVSTLSAVILLILLFRRVRAAPAPVVEMAEN